MKCLQGEASCGIGTDCSACYEAHITTLEAKNEEQAKTIALWSEQNDANAEDAQRLRDANREYFEKLQELERQLQETEEKHLNEVRAYDALDHKFADEVWEKNREIEDLRTQLEAENRELRARLERLCMAVLSNEASGTPETKSELRDALTEAQDDEVVPLLNTQIITVEGECDELREQAACGHHSYRGDACSDCGWTKPTPPKPADETED